MRSFKSVILSCLLTLTVLGRDCLADFYENDAHVKVIDKYSTFENEILKGESVWMIQFFSPTCPDSKKAVQQYSRVAEVTRGIFNLAAVDMSTEAGKRIGATLKVDSYPTFYIYGDDKNNPRPYTGPVGPQEILQGLVEFVVYTLQMRADPNAKEDPNVNKDKNYDGTVASKIKNLSMSNFQVMVLDNPEVSAVAFAAPWCGYCRQLQPEWEEAAKKLAGSGAFVGWVDATVETELANIYGVQAFPSIKLFSGGKKAHSDATDYNGEKTASAIVKFLLDEVDRTGIRKEIPELTSKTILEEECGGTNRVCVLAALPHILDSGAEGRNKYKDLITKVYKTFRGSSYSFIWFEGGSQPDLEDALELTFGFPALVAYSLDKEAYAVMRGSFNEKKTTTFLHGVSSGRQPTVKLSKIPKIVTVEPWDGEDAAPIEDEMSLSEIMGWDDENDAEEEKESEDEL